MRLTIYPWLGREFVRVFGEGLPGLAVPEATRELLERLAGELAPDHLSLNDVVRTRLFAQDKAGRDAGSATRREVLSGRARSASSGLIAPAVLSSGGAVALELIVLRPRTAPAEKRLQEYEPVRTPLRYLVLDGMQFVSGETQPGVMLADQVAATLAAHGASLKHAGASWDKLVLVSCFLHRSQSVDALRQALRASLPLATIPLECETVDGFAGEGRLVEIEVTAVVE
ncbi:MAG TPA: hypothetical protein VII06_21275 [Chloroflexota bacterium]|jgi:enamine deaminase RidA (YjgF/YER057c/UK114 family)